MSDGTSPLLEVRGLRRHFGGVQAVTNLNLTVREGEILGLIGPNGAGKSTALDLISGFKAPDAGTVKFAGTEIQGWPAHRVSGHGLIRTFQSPREWARLTVMDNMLIAAKQEGRDKAWRALFTRPSLARAELVDRQKARDLLERFGLSRLRDEYAGNLSGGQKRLLEFSRIAMARPRMVLLDEPLAGVNPVLQTGILAAIQDLNRDGITVLLIEHNLPWVEEACAKIVVMAQGADIASGTMESHRTNKAVIDAYLGEVATNV
jgi:ABC-type branched-subunit amino acid transport system ATPase component